MGPRLYPEDSDPPPRPNSDWSIDPADRPSTGGGGFYGEEPPRSVMTFLRPVVYGLVAIGCAGALWYAYNQGRDVGAGTGPVRLIQADQGATKIRPTDAGGADVPGQDMQVYNPSQPGGKFEHLLPAPEQPLARPQAAPAGADASAPLPLQEIGPTAAPKSAPPIPGSGNVMPPTTTSGVLTATSSAPLPPPPTATATVSKPIALATAAAAPKPAQIAAAGGSFRVQIAATRDEATARSEFERLKKAHADLLGELSATVVKADLGDKGVFYRVQAGPVADHDKAEKLCTELKKFSIACIIVKP